VKSLLELLILPPGNVLALFAAGLLVARRNPRLGRALQIGAFVLLYLLSTPLVAGRLLAALEPAAAFDAADAEGAQAVVILSADIQMTPEYGGATLGGLTLERLRYGAEIARLTGLPILVTGGILSPGTRPVASLMQEALAKDYGLAARWVEDAAHSTAENARFSAALLRRDGIATVILVTHAWHMPRAVAAFEANGLKVIAAPTMFTRKVPPIGPDALMPSVTSLRSAYFALHEWVGLGWYRLGYALNGPA
jgi:uncharacterized SAM-binding protein YcdF (DUF218 family)